ncbi:MAG: tyrosine-type recombinase/integrase [Rhodocyclaceae bacterium]|nr:tyrosine-type recombinase/integrase [Rhodocyclaceae bacterium]
MRPKTTGRHLPPRMLRRAKRLVSGKTWESYYYNGRDENGKRIEIPLGADLNEAKRKWAELECKPTPIETGIMKVIFDRYARDIIPTKAPKTQKDNEGCLKMLRAVFDTAPINAITPQHIAQYRDNRGAKAPVRANRELALFSHIWNIAREWGYTAKENPVRGVRKNREKPRDFYADDAVWSAVYASACVELTDAMDLNYLTGQRPADVLKMRLADIKDGAIEVQQNKTKKRLRILLDIEGVRTELGKVIDRIKGRERKVKSLYLIATPAGKSLNRWTLRTRFDDARNDAITKAKKAGDEELAARIRAFQFRDIRPKAASELPLEHASKLLGHTEHEITEKVYRRVGEVVKPTK